MHISESVGIVPESKLKIFVEIIRLIFCFDSALPTTEISRRFIKKTWLKKDMQSCRPIFKLDEKVMFDEEKISATFKKINGLANLIRLKILKLLLEHEELCVCDLEMALGLKQPRVSYHLALLMEGGVIKRRESGPWSFYRINSNASEILGMFELK